MGVRVTLGLVVAAAVTLLAGVISHTPWLIFVSIGFSALGAGDLVFSGRRDRTGAPPAARSAVKGNGEDALAWTESLMEPWSGAPLSEAHPAPVGPSAPESARGAGPSVGETAGGVALVPGPAVPGPRPARRRTFDPGAVLPADGVLPAESVLPAEAVLPAEGRSESGAVAASEEPPASAEAPGSAEAPPPATSGADGDARSLGNNTRKPRIAPAASELPRPAPPPRLTLRSPLHSARATPSPSPQPSPSPAARSTPPAMPPQPPSRESPPPPTARPPLVRPRPPAPPLRSPRMPASAPAVPMSPSPASPPAVLRPPVESPRAIPAPVIPNENYPFPIEDYDRLVVAEIVPLLPELDDEELVAVLLHEQKGANRIAIVNRIDALLEGEG